MVTTQETILSEDEIEAIVLASLPDDGTTIPEEDIDQVLKWATQTRVDQVLLDGLISGRFRVATAGDELKFGIREAPAD